jgi:hypothetical protein
LMTTASSGNIFFKFSAVHRSICYASPCTPALRRK